MSRALDVVSGGRLPATPLTDDALEDEFADLTLDSDTETLAAEEVDIDIDDLEVTQAVAPFATRVANQRASSRGRAEFSSEPTLIYAGPRSSAPRLSTAPPPPRRSRMASEPTSPYSRPAPPPPAPSSVTTTPLGEPPLESWDDTDPWDAPDSARSDGAADPAYDSASWPRDPHRAETEHPSSVYPRAYPPSGYPPSAYGSSAPPPSHAYQSSGSTAPFSLTHRPEQFIPRRRSRAGRGRWARALSGRLLFTSGAAAGLLLAALGAWSVPRLGEQFARVLERNEGSLAALGLPGSGDANSSGQAPPEAEAPSGGVRPDGSGMAAARGPEGGAPTPARSRDDASSSSQTKAGTSTSSAVATNGVQRVEDLPEVTLGDLLRVPIGSRPSCESQLADWTPSDLGNSRALASQHRRGGQMHLLGGRNDLAEVELCKSIAYEPTGPGAPLLATLYLNQRSPEAAQKVLERALELDPNADDLRELLGDALSQLGRISEARSAWLAALHLDAASDRRVREVSRHWVRTSVAVRRSGDIARAERLLRRSVTLDPSSQTAARLLAEALERQGDMSLADAWYAQALSL